MCVFVNSSRDLCIMKCWTHSTQETHQIMHTHAPAINVHNKRTYTALMCTLCVHHLINPVKTSIIQMSHVMFPTNTKASIC